ncbi:MAG: LacI family DNA-binding transcriptional regulator [Lachnospiraceae bacterium]|nr:LacI family DNA-binding transcriptional regulator [Lachnospiraceae bacterium]
MDRKITIADVAEALGVSKTTVSRAISGKGRIGEETRKKVLEYIEVTDYKPNVIAKSLAQSKTYNIAMILPADCNIAELPFFQTCMYGACEAAAERDYDVLTIYTLGNESKNLERVLINNKIDGIIQSRTTVNDSISALIAKRGIPFVAIGTTDDPSIVRVDHDHRSACRELTAHLIASGLRRIALIGGNNTHMVTRNRYRGFVDAFKEAKIGMDPELIYLNAEGNDNIDEVTHSLLVKGAECIVCMDDMICSRVLQKLRRDRITVPDHVKVASFYNSSLLESHIPAVTTLEFDVKQLGETAASVLIDLIEGKEVKQTTLLPYRLKIKETT